MHNTPQENKENSKHDIWKTSVAFFWETVDCKYIYIYAYKKINNSLSNLLLFRKMLMVLFLCIMLADCSVFVCACTHTHT